MSADGFAKFVSFEGQGARADAKKMIQKLPPGVIMSELEKDERDAQLVGEMQAAGSRCTAVCTSDFKAEGLRRYRFEFCLCATSTHHATASNLDIISLHQINTSSQQSLKSAEPCC
jgi:hypothetical protein